MLGYEQVVHLYDISAPQFQYVVYRYSFIVTRYLKIIRC